MPFYRVDFVIPYGQITEIIVVKDYPSSKARGYNTIILIPYRTIYNNEHFPTFFGYISHIFAIWAEGERTRVYIIIRFPFLTSYYSKNFSVCIGSNIGYILAVWSKYNRMYIVITLAFFRTFANRTS